MDDVRSIGAIVSPAGELGEASGPHGYAGSCGEVAWLNFANMTLARYKWKGAGSARSGVFLLVFRII